MKPKDLKFPYRWEERKPTIVDGVFFIPEYYDRHGEFQFPAWNVIFGNDLPVMMEYCSGNGAWIVEKAKNSRYNWVAVEYRFDRARQIWSKMKNYGLSNLFIVCGEALTFSQYLSALSVHEVYVNFPDPWPKERHAKNRLFQKPFIGELKRIVKNAVTIVTDSEPYSEQILSEMISSGWHSKFSEPHFITEWEGYGTSYFETLWLQKGKTLRYFQFENDSVRCNTL